MEEDKKQGFTVEKAKEFEMDFYFNYDLGTISKILDTKKQLSPNFLLAKPFNGIYQIKVDGVDITKVANIDDDDALTAISYPLEKIIWLNKNLQSVLDSGEPDYNNPEWKTKHVFNYPRGDYSLNMPMYSKGDSVIIEWNLWESFEFPNGKVQVPSQLFGRRALETISKAQAFYSFLPQLSNQEKIKSFERKLKENKKFFE